MGPPNENLKSNHTMSRILFLGAAILILSASFASADRATFDRTKTQIAMPLTAPPTIDGCAK